MSRNALFALALVCVGCASDPADPSDTLDPGAADGGVYEAGRTALAGAGGSSAIDVAGRMAVDAAGTGEPADAGTNTDAGAPTAAGVGGSLSGSAAGGGGVGGSAGAVEVAGTGAAGSSVAGSSGQAGAAAPVVRELWTITQSNAATGTVVNAVDDPQLIQVRLEPSGPGSMPATTLALTFGRNDTVDHTFTMVSGASSLDAAYIACSAFRASWKVDGSADKQSSVTTETPARVTYVRLVASSKLTGRTEAWQLAVSVSWTAYGY